MTSRSNDTLTGSVAAAVTSDAAAPPPASEQSTRTRSRAKGRFGTAGRGPVLAVQAGIVVVVLLGWEYVPQMSGISRHSHFLDPFFISSPSRIYDKLGRMITGHDGGPYVWPYLWPTFQASIFGTVIGLVLGGLIGLLLGSFRFAGRVFRPFVVVFNAIPRIALIPIIVVVMGSGIASSITIAVLVVLFVGLFNAQEGARSVDRHVLDNVRLLGASGWEIMWKVRSRYALAWTLASLPVAVSFAIVSVVSAEILIGGDGLGGLMSTATLQADADLTFAVVLFLAAFALIILGLAEMFKRRVLRWWLSDAEDS